MFFGSPGGPTHWVEGTLSAEAKRLRSEGDYSASFSAEINNESALIPVFLVPS